MEIVFTIEQLESVANKIIAQQPPKVVIFHGEMGVGKTTLIKQLCKTLGVSSATSSPTFSLVNEYETIDNQVVYHFDFYRINDVNEAYDIGAEEYFYSGNSCLIEWSDKVEEILPSKVLKVNIEVLSEAVRKIEIVSS